MYDTTPADEPTWVVPPFEARRISNYENLGECILGRGAEDTKGPVATLMNAVGAYRAAKVPLPCNIIMLFEASELGSKSLPAFVAAHADELRGADVCFWPWYTQKSDGMLSSYASQFVRQTNRRSRPRPVGCEFVDRHAHAMFPGPAPCLSDAMPVFDQ